MKVLILCDHFGTGGGAGTVALNLAVGFSKNHKVQVLTAQASADLKTEGYKVLEHSLDYDLKKRNFVGLKNNKAVEILSSHLKKFRPEVALIHNLHTYWSYHSLKVLADAGVRTVLTFHDVSVFTPYVKLCDLKVGDYHYSWLRHFWDAKFNFNPLRNIKIREYLKHATKKVAVSAELKKALEQNSILIDDVVRNGIKPSEIKEEVDETSIFFGGRLSSAKGIIQAVHYLKLLKERHNLEPKLIVAGNEGVATDKMKKEAERQGVLKHLKFTGWLPRAEYYKTLASCEVVIVPSICFDSLPTVILEAMALSKPVVATVYGGAAEMVDDGVTGYVVDPFDENEFAAKIAAALKDSRELGSAGRERFQKEFTRDIMVKNYEKLIKTM